jgi:transmembrane sensor
MDSDNSNTVSKEVELGEQAAEWLLRLEGHDADSDDEFASETARITAFFTWLESSPHHLRVFLETLEIHRRLALIDSEHLLSVQSLLEKRADVIPLRKEGFPPSRPARSAPSNAEALPSWKRSVFAQLARVPLRQVAAAIIVCALGFMTHNWLTSADVYMTNVGEQRSTKLEDGSFVYLNTASKVEVQFTRGTRKIRLIQGEALFVVEKDSRRPFTVSVGDTTVRALGTQFNVRRFPEGSKVSVVEGVVQLTADDELSGTSAEKLAAGEEVKVENGRIGERTQITPGRALAWRERRLIFHDTPLIDIAEEFNRYNRTKIRIEDDAAKEILLSGIFDADRPQALILYAASNARVTVEPRGSDWVVRAQ